MNTSINAKRLRASLPEVVRNVRKGGRYTVIYRSQPAFQIVPVDHADATVTPLEDESLFRAPAVGRSDDGHDAADHDRLLYGR